ncbi:hypothetical protein OVA29_17285 [Exiguobacterium sp. SL14]|nr:hypothetical protein [Exiguobacterium sp. SL14]MCY1692127.1 hypothetical protein [Exiguobacterium sp. SL14]
MLTKWMHTLIDTLVASGVRDFVISPGSVDTTGYCRIPASV